MGLSDSLKGPHKQVNEDGKILDHQGYTEGTCIVCRTTYIVAIIEAIKILTCGRSACMKEADGRK